MQKNKLNMVFYVLIVLIVVVILVLITINKKKDSGSEVKQVGTEQNTNMQITADSLKITTLVEGTGQVAKEGDTVAMNYTGTLADGTVFDSNVDPKFNHVEPFPFTIGAGQVIKGWDLGVAGMKIGEKRQLVIAPELAYGEAGIGPIPPNATLTFEVELLAIKK